MKKHFKLVIFWFVMLSWHSCHAQLKEVFKVEKNQVTLYADSMTVKEGFALLHYLIPKGPSTIRIVIKDGKEYYQTGWFLNRKRKAYMEINGKTKLVRI